MTEAEHQKPKTFSRRSYHISELPEEPLRAMAAAKMNPAHDHLNALLKNRKQTALYAWEIPENELAEFEKIQPPAEAAEYNHES